MEIKDPRPPLDYMRLTAAHAEIDDQISKGMGQKQASEVVLRKYFPLNTSNRVRGLQGP